MSEAVQPREDTFETNIRLYEKKWGDEVIAEVTSSNDVVTGSNITSG